MKFEIVSVYRSTSELVSVKVRMVAKEYLKAAKQSLGQLYGIDMSNEIYHQTGIAAHNPIVDDHARSKGGFKVVELTYVDSNWVECDNVIRVDFQTKQRAA